MKCQGNSFIFVQVSYVQVGDIRVNSHKLKVAKKQPTAYKMGRKLLPEFFEPKELSTCSSVPPKPGKLARPQADKHKLDLLLGIVLYVHMLIIYYIATCVYVPQYKIFFT